MPRLVWVAIRPPRREPKPSQATLFLIASNPPQIASKFVTPSTNHEFKSVGERLDRILGLVGTNWARFGSGSSVGGQESKV